MPSPPWLSTPPLGTVGLALAVGVLAYLAGRRSGSRLSSGSSGSSSRPSSSSSSTRCECGAKLGGATANDMFHHRRSRRHANNLLIAGRCRIRVAENWAEYRHCIEHCVSASDAVLEVGCGRGVTTALLAGRARRAVGLDSSAKVIGMARERHPHVQFEVGAAEDIGGIQRLGGGDGFAALFLDINGSRELGTVVPLLERYDAALAPRGLRLIVVKNARPKRLLLKARCVGEGEGDGGDGGPVGPVEHEVCSVAD